MPTQNLEDGTSAEDIIRAARQHLRDAAPYAGAFNLGPVNYVAPRVKKALELLELIDLDD